VLRLHQHNLGYIANGLDANVTYFGLAVQTPITIINKQ